jgi:hypothetical protein
MQATATIHHAESAVTAQAQALADSLNPESLPSKAREILVDLRQAFTPSGALALYWRPEDVAAHAAQIVAAMFQQSEATFPVAAQNAAGALLTPLVEMGFLTVG